MAVAGQSPSEVHLNADLPPAPGGGYTNVIWQAGDPYPDPNNTALLVRDVSAYYSASGGPSGGAILPLVNGDLPGPSLMADIVGQCIGVPL
jgi:hypothetical protein